MAGVSFSRVFYRQDKYKTTPRGFEHLRLRLRERFNSTSTKKFEIDLFELFLFLTETSHGRAPHYNLFLALISFLRATILLTVKSCITENSSPKLNKKLVGIEFLAQIYFIKFSRLQLSFGPPKRKLQSL